MCIIIILLLLYTLLFLLLLLYLIVIIIRPDRNFNKSTSELRGQGVGGRGGGGGGGGESGVTFVAMQLFHKFISSSNWLMKHTFGEEQCEQPKGKKNVNGEKSPCRLLLLKPFGRLRLKCLLPQCAHIPLHRDELPRSGPSRRRAGRRHRTPA